MERNDDVPATVAAESLQIPCTLNLASESRHHDPKFIKMAKDQFTFKQEDYGAGQLEAEIGSALKKHGIVGARLKIAELRQAMSMDGKRGDHKLAAYMHYTQSTISSYQNVVRDIVFPINQEELQRFLKSDALEAIISVAKHIKDMPSTLKDLTGNQIVKVEVNFIPVPNGPEDIHSLKYHDPAT
ncbi:hypothetical protein BGX31_001257 [Mortierella sp. GBA43]|nr:hypothetical protein BGX31_001257 [Mortierella sp. GBA43]